jgi:hypothetical protein
LVLLHELLELGQDAVRHGRPVLGVVLEASHREGGHLVRLLLGVLPGEILITFLRSAAAAPSPPA